MTKETNHITSIVIDAKRRKKDIADRLDRYIEFLRKKIDEMRDMYMEAVSNGRKDIAWECAHYANELGYELKQAVYMRDH